MFSYNPVHNNLPLLLKNLKQISTYIHIICRLGFYSYITSLTDHTQLEDCVSPIERNYVSTNIKTPCKSVEILEKAAKTHTNMTVHNAINMIFALFKASKYMEEDLQSIKQHIGFKCLWEVLNRNVKFMETNEIIISLKMLTYFKIPASSVLTQSLL